MRLEERKQFALFCANMALKQITQVKNELRQARAGFELRHGAAQLVMILHQPIDHGTTTGYLLTHQREQDLFFSIEMGHQISAVKF